MTPTREEVIRVARECGALANAAGTIQLLYPELERLAHHFYEAGAAAAPDLLFQLQAAANYIDALGGDSKSYRAAIAKATGEKT